MNEWKYLFPMSRFKWPSSNKEQYWRVLGNHTDNKDTQGKKTNCLLRNIELNETAYQKYLD